MPARTRRYSQRVGAEDYSNDFRNRIERSA